MKVTGIERQVCEDIANRQQIGIKKYNTTVKENPLALKEWMNHAYEEALDMAIYLKRAMQEVDTSNEHHECDRCGDIEGVVLCTVSQCYLCEGCFGMWCGMNREECGGCERAKNV